MSGGVGGVVWLSEAHSNEREVVMAHLLLCEALLTSVYSHLCRVTQSPSEDARTRR